MIQKRVQRFLILLAYGNFNNVEKSWHKAVFMVLSNLSMYAKLILKPDLKKKISKMFDISVRYADILLYKVRPYVNY